MRQKQEYNRHCLVQRNVQATVADYIITFCHVIFRARNVTFADKKKYACVRGTAAAALGVFCNISRRLQRTQTAGSSRFQLQIKNQQTSLKKNDKNGFYGF
jgi:hypothetical protein